MTNIKAGYMLEIHSYNRNDYFTTRLEGLSPTEVTFYILIAKQFMKDGPVHLEDLEEEALNNHLDAVLAKHKATGGHVPAEWERTDLEDEYHYDDLIGNSIVSNNGYYWNTISDYTVYHFPSEIADVTVSFR